MAPQDPQPESRPERIDEPLPVRMLNEFAYCPRLFYLMHVDGRWEDNRYTVEGRYTHRRLDASDDPLPESRSKGAKDPADEDPEPTIARSVRLESRRLGLVAKLDLVETDGDEAVPVDTKRGRVPANPERSWEPERVQLMAQGMLLREHGYSSTRGVLYFAGSKSRVDVPFTDELEARTMHLIEQARRASRLRTAPPPLDDSPKCPRCSLNGICLPDETLVLRTVPPDPAAPETRRLYPERDDALPFYVQEQGARVGKSGSALVVKKGRDELTRIGLNDVSQLVLCGNVQVSAQTCNLLCESGIPIVHLSMGNWFYGITHGIQLKNAYNRVAQFEAANDSERILAFSKAVVRAKGANQRTLLRRNAKPRPKRSLEAMARLIRDIDKATGVDRLLGIEGSIASCYFRGFAAMLGSADVSTDWNFNGRNRRPPRDPVNALLSFVYALLAKECTVALLTEGLDPWWGLFHRPRHGRPALALDLMEEFRPLIADSAAITAVNTRMVEQKDFVVASSGCAMKPAARKALIHAYEARMDGLVTHPVFKYRCSWRAIVRVQARILARWLRGEIPEYVPITTR